MQRGSQPRHRDGTSLCRDGDNFPGSASASVRRVCSAGAASLAEALWGVMLSFLRCEEVAVFLPH